MRLRPKRAFNRSVARNPKVKAAVRENTETIAANARVFAAPHGTLASRISTEYGDVDGYVVMSDNGKKKNEPAAAAIEFGGTFKNGRTQKGLRVLGRAVDTAGG
ncbi:DUF5403 family protein [Cumulibacter soli]|uniref:DUF5403 family protein n=1 Tax=Cumulibacter soli TaxID=2546344 RepID=UPI0024446D67|nr:DUF5403 family protein [Cumulibacter soli]